MKPTAAAITRRQALQRAGLLAAAGLAHRTLAAEPHPSQAPASLPLVRPANAAVQQRRQRMAEAPVEVADLGGGLAVFSVAGTGNVTAHLGDDAVLLIDAGPAEYPALEQALARRTSRPVRTVVNTHWHFDHTDGNGRWRRSGADVLAHRQVRQRLADPTTVAFLGFRFEASPIAALPNVTLDTSLTLHHGGSTVELEHVPAAHTDGDVIAHFREANVIATGDLFFAGTFPFIDGPAGGSLGGMIEATRRLLDRCDPRTRIVPGHGSVAGRPKLSVTYDLLRTCRDRILPLREKGLSADEAVAVEPLRDLDPAWGSGFVTTPNFIRLVHSLGR